MELKHNISRFTRQSKIRVSAIKSERGTIYDRNGNIIAKEGKAYQVGLVPGKMNETTDVKRLQNYYK